MYEPRKQFLPFHYRHQRWAILVCHRRAGKTVACIAELVTRALATSKIEARYAYIAPYFSQAKTVSWDYLKHYAQPVIRSLDDIRESELSVRLANGSIIRLYGADNPNALRGIYLDGVVMDEVADMKPSLWGEVIRPTLSDRKGWAVFIGTPKGDNEFRRIWDDSVNDPEWFRLMLKASDTIKLDPQPIPNMALELASARKTMTEDAYNQEYECSFEAAIPGAVYGKWMREATEAGRVKDFTIDAAPVCTAWDLGYDDSTSIWWWQLLPGEIRLIDYYESNHQDVPHYVDVIKGKPYRYDKHWVPHDAAHKLLAAGGRSIVEQANALGLKMHSLPATTQQQSEQAARETIKRCWFHATNCKEGIEALRQYHYEWDEDKKTFRSKPRHDWSSHAADAFEIIGQAWYVPKAKPEPPKPRFLDEMTADELFFKDLNKPKYAERI
jgi:phage terminase large subunit